MNYYPFNSRNELYKKPFGAAKSNTPVKIRILLHADANVKSAFLRIRRDGEDLSEIELTAKEWLEDYRFYDTEISLPAGLYWYDFRYTSEYGDFFIRKEKNGNGIFSREAGEPWQQTVFESGFKTPENLAGGIIYQIFPDRFCNSGKEKQNVPPDRFLVSDWNSTPQYLQNETKNTLGNDYFGGDLAGIESKLPYLESLGVTVIYLNPIFEAHSNHRYNTANYLKIDPLLGTEEDFISLCKAAEKCGISVIIDGVFSHTGADSIYFDRFSRYPTVGAYESENSDFRNWYKFGASRDDYASWWGIKSLPETDETSESFIKYICGENGVLKHWLGCGAGGVRLDVADELPDRFLEKLRECVKSTKENAYILGEVWEDASNKVSYGARRKFLLGKQLDSVMNYPFANGIVEFVRTGCAEKLAETVYSICENYPKPAVNLLMNHIGTHDTARILTVLAQNDDNYGDRAAQAKLVLSEEQYAFAKRRLKAAAVIQYTLPGMPSLFYGDEAGLTGGGDPFCRAAYPYGKEDTDLLEFYRALGKVRLSAPALKTGDFKAVHTGENVFSFIRKDGESTVFVAVNAGPKTVTPDLPKETENAEIIFGDRTLNEYGYLIAIKK